MMHVLNANATSGTFHVVCGACLWVAPTPLPESQAFAVADNHANDCPQSVPASRKPAQQRRARALLSGNY